MRVLPGIPGSIITILILLKRLADSGIDLAGLNPSLWRCCRQWRMEAEENPINAIGSPMELTALLMTAEEKKAPLRLMENELQLSKRDASDALIDSSYMLGDGFV